MNFCPKCGAPLNPGAKFCPKCGAPIRQVATAATAQAAPQAAPQPQPGPQQAPGHGLFGSATSMLNRYTGDDKPVEVNLRNLFSQVFKKHTQAEAEEIFIAGTASTTPRLDAVATDWGKPWLFSRVLLLLGVSFVLLLYAVGAFDNANAVPGVILTGAFAVPFSAAVFFFEMNAYKNISFYQLLKMFFLGGVLSLLATLYLYQYVTFSRQEIALGVMTWKDTFSVGIVEELGKLLIVAYFVRRGKYNYILNGILCGAAVGAGFAAFETAGYIYNTAPSQLVDVALLRASLAIGGHVVWAAISGGALVMVKGKREFDYTLFFKPNFLIFFGLSVLLHALWDKGLAIFGSIDLSYFVYIVAAWVIVFVLINAGLREAKQLQDAAKTAN